MSPITFVTVGLTAGAALAAIPVVIHLIMRQTPKHVVFPALRLVKERQKTSRKRLRIRNWLLLLARMALVALMAFALARPKLYSQTKLGDREIETALGLVFDTSYSMQYTERDKTRLREAQDRALSILRRSHEGSQVFVVDSAEPTEPIAMSPPAASKRVEALTLRAVNGKLNAAVGLAYKAVAASDLPRHEVYVFTDLARSAWDIGRPVEGLDASKKVRDGVATYVVRLSPEELRDAAIVAAEPVGGLAIGDQPLTIRAKVRATGPAVTRRVELLIDGVSRGQKDVAIPADGEVEVPPFITPKLAQGLHQVEVRLGGQPDPLAFDDRRYFTLDVQPPLKVLLVAEHMVDVFYVENAIDPDGSTPGAARPFQVTKLSPKGLANRSAEALKEFSSIWVLNVPSLPDSSWSTLTQFVREGGGLVVAPGHRVDVANYNGPSAGGLLPATFATPFPQHPRPPQGFGEGDWDHPLFKRYRDDIPKNLARVTVYRRAGVTIKQGSRSILDYQDKAPALIERGSRDARSGKVLLWTTSLSRRAEADEGRNVEAWTEFPFDWSFVAVVGQSVAYLAGLDDRRLTYEAGEDVRLPLDPAKRFKSFTVKAQDASTSDRLGEPAGSTLNIPAPTRLGPWTVTATAANGPSQVLGFSVNPPRDEDRITPLRESDLDRLFGAKNYQLAKDEDELKRKQGDVRIGRELFPWVMALILALVTAENFLANRFYRERPATPATTTGGSAMADGR